MPAGRTIPAPYGHSTAANTIGVGATPWWAPAPYLGQNPLANEPFSSSGPGDFRVQPRRDADHGRPDAGSEPVGHGP